jgi:tripartite-type tricarboxylate transporter receptor subunit TctC
MTHSPLMSRRAFAGGLAAAGALPLLPSFPGLAAAQGAYPSRSMRVLIPTGQGGGAEKLARAFDAAWSKIIGQPFEYEFHAGAGGQVGYTLFVQKRDRNGHSLLFGNMGPEMIMYVTQKPAFKYPEDFTYFCRTDIDDSCVFVRRDSPYKDLKSLVEAAKKKPLNVALSRIPHPATLGMIALSEATGARFNYIPYGGGNPTFIAMMSGETEVGALPIANILALSDKFRVIGVFNDKNIFAKQTENAPAVNSVFGTSIPDLSSSRSWAVHTEWANANPKQFEILERTAKEAHESPVFRDTWAKGGNPVEALVWGDRKTCHAYAENMIKLAQRYEKQLTARGKN